MGRLEKQIIAGALALVGILLSVVVYRGVDQRQEPPSISEWSDPGDSETERTLIIESPVDEKPAPDVQRENKERSVPPVPVDDAELQPEDPSVLPTEVESNQEATPVPEKPQASVLAFGANSGISTESLPDWRTTYTVKKGDTLWLIAQRELGSSTLVHEILVLNEGLEPTQLQIGQEINLPKLRPAKNPPATQAPSSIGVLEHTVAVGDSLWRIVRRYRVDGGINALVKANDLLPDSDTSLQVGWVLRIPTE